MIIQAGVTTEYRNLLEPIYEDADAGLRSVLAETAGSSLGDREAALHDVLPLLGGASSDAVSTVSAAFFDSLMEIQEVRRPVASDILEPLDAGIWHALVGWAFSDSQVGSVLERGGEALLYSLLSGGLSRSLARAGADTMIGNAAIQTELMRSQRVPQAGCCNFCAMLASRFAEYSSQASAGQVVGRGLPVEATILGYDARGNAIRKQGGQARGLRPRGARQIGEDYHDNCRCSIVIVTEGNYTELQNKAEEYYDAYREASDKVNDGLTLKSTPVGTKDRLKNKYEWVKADGEVTTPKSRTNEIVKAMDLLNPVAQKSPTA